MNGRDYLFTLKKLKKDLIILLLFLILSVISIILLLHTHTLYGAFDMRFHTKRIIELIRTYDHHNFLPYYAFNEFHGSAVLSLYPFFNLLPIIFISFFTKSYINMIYIFIAFNIFMTLTISFYSSKQYKKSWLVSSLFALIYSLSSMIFAYSFINMDLGQLSALAFLPLVIFGFLNLLKSNGLKWIELTLGLTLIIYSHILSAVIVTGLLFFWLIINFKSISKPIIKSVLYSCIVITLLTSFIWIRLFSITLNNIGNIQPVAPSLVVYNIINAFKLGITNIPNFYISILAIISMVLSIFMYKYLNKECKQMLWISILTLITFSNLIPWRTFSNHLIILKILYLFQFTYRFCIIPQIFLCYLLAIIISKCIHNIRIKNIYKYSLISIAFITIIGLQLCNQESLIKHNKNNMILTHTLISNHTKDTAHNQRVSFNKFMIVHNRLVNINTSGTKFRNNNQLRLLCNSNLLSANSDYFPVKSVKKLRYINNNDSFYRNHIIKFKNIGYNKFIFINRKNIDKLNLPILHYNKEHLLIYDNGHLSSYYPNKYNLITLTHVNKGKHIIRIVYKTNDWSYIFMIALFLSGIIIIIKKRYRILG